MRNCTDSHNALLGKPNRTGSPHLVYTRAVRSEHGDRRGYGQGSSNELGGHRPHDKVRSSRTECSGMGLRIDGLRRLALAHSPSLSDNQLKYSGS